MGSRDKQWREKKKPKKGESKLTSPIVTVPVEVEVARKKGKKPPEFPEET
ncbi:MAG: hypothetical protein N3E40_06010 [Dehalococcoidia bacterium]|nr:hypothetical protein [Dehalococcoidia bacterium]